jgi:hypothetical protein
MKKKLKGKVRLDVVVAMTKVDMISSEQFTLTVGTLEGGFVGDAYDKETMARRGETS